MKQLVIVNVEFSITSSTVFISRKKKEKHTVTIFHQHGNRVTS